jgi:single-strand DNA-binding protein
MAVSERRTTKDGQNKEYTEWVNLEAWSGLAETMSKYLKKGSLIYAEGRLKTDSYDKDGEKRYFVKVVLSKIEFLDKKEGNGNGSGPVVGDEEPLGAEDEIPF